MLEKMCDLFAGVKMTVVSGIFLAISLVMMLTGTDFIIDPAWVTVVLSGYPLLYLAITRLVYKKWISSCLLISIAMVASLALGEVFAAGEVAFIMAIGAILEDMTVVRARKGLAQLIALAPVQGRRLKETEEGTVEEMIDASEIQEGDILRVLPGESIPVDGVVLTGESSIDQSIITGESLPVDKVAGDDVYCGTMNCFGSVDIKATAVGQDSSLQKLIRMVEQADESKAPLQRIADQWSVWLVPIALGIAIGAFVVNWMMGLPVMDALNRGVTVLVVFCPCALALATPTSIMAAIGQATKHGVIIKSGEALEAMGRIDTIAFDKTGTLTSGTLEVANVHSFAEDMSEETLVTMVGSIEKRSEHPLAKAVVEYTVEKNLTLPVSDAFRMEAGQGVSAEIDGTVYYCGNMAYLNRHDVMCTADQMTVIEGYRAQGKALILMANAQQCVGVIALSDTLREDSPAVVSALKKLEVKNVLLTGDNMRAAQHFADKVGLDHIKAELMPAEKVEAVKQLQDEGHKVCMIGDGVNDAPALKTASVGVAMGSMGSDIAIEAADIALMGDDIKQVVYLKRLSKSCINTIRANITASMIINAVAVTLSCMGVLNPVTGALVHNAGSCLVVLNAALLYDRKFDQELESVPTED